MLQDKISANEIKILNLDSAINKLEIEIKKDISDIEFLKSSSTVTGFAAIAGGEVAIGIPHPVAKGIGAGISAASSAYSVSSSLKIKKLETELPKKIEKLEKKREELVFQQIKNLNLRSEEESHTDKYN